MSRTDDQFVSFTIIYSVLAGILFWDHLKALWKTCRPLTDAQSKTEAFYNRFVYTTTAILLVIAAVLVVLLLADEPRSLEFSDTKRTALAQAASMLMFVALAVPTIGMIRAMAASSKNGGWTAGHVIAWMYISVVLGTGIWYLVMICGRAANNSPFDGSATTIRVAAFMFEGVILVAHMVAGLVFFVWYTRSAKVSIFSMDWIEAVITRIVLYCIFAVFVVSNDMATVNPNADGKDTTVYDCDYSGNQRSVAMLSITLLALMVHVKIERLIMQTSLLPVMALETGAIMASGADRIYGYSRLSTSETPLAADVEAQKKQKEVPAEQVTGVFSPYYSHGFMSL